jgi:hypothetical protein
VECGPTISQQESEKLTLQHAQDDQTPDHL